MPAAYSPVTLTALAALLVLSRPVQAEPRGGTVVDGAAIISQAGAITNINQSSPKAIINWQGFSVGAHETVNFYQPNALSVTLNRVIGNEASVIDGAINANGQIFIVNSAGVLFGKGSQINVGGLVASTLDISNQDFMAGNYTFSGTSNAAVVNQGRLRAHGGGYVALLGKTVSNEGVISARLGTVAMAAGEKLTLNFDGNSLLDVTIDKGALNALVENKRAIRADGGRVIMTAKAADQLLSAQVNNTGIVQARTIAALKGGTTSSGQVRVGKIKILAEGGKVNIAGRLDASARRGGNGGFIETSGAKVKIADGAVITTKATAGRSGTWLIDPTDFNIVAGSSALTGSGIGAATLASNLANGNVSITTVAGGTQNGDINVNAAVSWQADTMLTLTAHGNININEAITATGDAAGLTLNAGNNIYINNAVSFSGANATLALNYGGYNGTSVLTPMAGTDYSIRTKASYSGAVLDDKGNPVAKQDTSGGVYGSITFSNSANTNGLIINGQNYTLIHSMAQLPAISGVSGNYALARDLNASGTYTGAVIENLAGTFAGLGHTISNLTIAEPFQSNPGETATGLIGTAQGGSIIRDIGLLNANVTAYGRVGSLVGVNAGGTINGAYVTGSVSGASNVGGLVGYISNGGVISNSYSAAAVSGSINYRAFQYIGGLVGQSFGLNNKIISSHATGAVAWPVATDSISNNIGGLVGRIVNGVIADSYATNNIEVNDGATNVGGLVGFGGGASNVVSRSFATGNITGGLSNVGGLMGQNLGGGRITGSYATGNVTAGKNDSASYNFGGLVGLNSGGASAITDSFANGNVTVNGGNNAGGLVGSNSGTISGSTANGNVNGSPISDAMGGLVGNNSGTINSSRSNGDVTGQTAGGLVGSNSGTINNSSATGSVNSRDGGGRDVVHTDTGTTTNSTYRDVKAEQRAEAERIEAARIEAARLEAARVEAARVEAARQEAARQEAARQEAARLEAARLEAAAQAALQSQAARTGSTIATTGPGLSSSLTPPAPEPAKGEAVDDAFKQIEQQATSEDERRELERKAAVAAAAAQADRDRANQARANRGGGPGAGYGATIRSIDVDGQRFNLQGEGSRGTPATGGAQ